MEPAFLQCESHPGRLLVTHLQDVALRSCSAAPECVWLRWVGIFHDIGKATAFFQRYLHGEDVPSRLRRHAHLGAMWLLEYLETMREKGNGIAVIDEALAFLFIRRHHGRLDDLEDALAISSLEVNDFAAQLAAMECSDLKTWIQAELGETIGKPVIERVHTGRNVELLLQLRRPCSDALAMERFQSALRAFGLFIEADRDSAAGYSSDQFQQPPRLTSQDVEAYGETLSRNTTAAEPISLARANVFQRAVSCAESLSAERGVLCTLTVPTGAGKTLAALGWATKRRELRIKAGRDTCAIIYALPFTSIIDQNASVIRQIVSNSSNDESFLAVHHHLADPGDIANSGEESLARSWVEGWRSDMVSTTFVQVANALFHGTCADSRRFSRLAGAILILDEVQAIPADLWPVFRSALSSLRERFGTDILLVTATQPALFDDTERMEIGPGDLYNLSDAFDRYDLRADIGIEMSAMDIVGKLAEVFGDGLTTSCLIILNTVKEAIELHSLVVAQSWMNGRRLFHLSTNLRPKDRARILDEVKSCEVPHVLIATQVVEAGVDLSFDVVIRAIAPLDSIIQAAGRCNRHGARMRGRVIVVDPVGNSAIWIYGSTHISLSRQLLARMERDENGWLSEPRVAQLVTAYFGALKERIQRDTSSSILEAVRRLQFAALRGNGNDPQRAKKQVKLIDDQYERVPHFVETDESDAEAWLDLASALSTKDIWSRRQKLRALRNDIGKRVVEVPSRFQFGLTGGVRSESFMHVPLNISADFYDINTGWKRT